MQLAAKLGRDRMIMPLVRAVDSIARMRQRDPCQQKVRKGANPNLPASSSKHATPLHLAAENGHVYSCEMLLRMGAHVDSNFYENSLTPLHKAAENGHWLVCKMLLNENADPNFAGLKRHHTALRFAAEKGHLEICALLIECKASAKGRDGIAALNFAAKLGHTEVCRLLLASGSDVHTEYNGKTAWERAMAGGHSETAQMFDSFLASGFRTVEWVRSMSAIPRGGLGSRGGFPWESPTSSQHSMTASSKVGWAEMA